mmetsp:Transcript_7118/g.15702  ORF Transcript_7118/g.15702 Transcript_7118/m.15702 type:complete len:85 (-) Transcript_7118:957-1211(-)
MPWVQEADVQGQLGNVTFAHVETRARNVMHTKEITNTVLGRLLQDVNLLKKRKRMIVNVMYASLMEWSKPKTLRALFAVTRATR